MSYIQVLKKINVFPNTKKNHLHSYKSNSDAIMAVCCQIFINFFVKNIKVYRLGLGPPN